MNTSIQLWSCFFIVFPIISMFHPYYMFPVSRSITTSQHFYEWSSVNTPIVEIWISEVSLPVSLACIEDTSTVTIIVFWSYWKCSYKRYISANVQHREQEKACHMFPQRNTWVKLPISKQAAFPFRKYKRKNALESICWNTSQNTQKIHYVEFVLLRKKGGHQTVSW